MKVSPEARDKADPKLLSTLGKADEDDTLRVILTLGEEPFARTIPRFHGSFGDRTAARRVLTEERKAMVANQIGDVVEHLRRLPLRINGGEISPMVVAEGPAKAIVEALETFGVRHGTLDRAFTVIEPRRAAVW